MRRDQYLDPRTCDGSWQRLQEDAMAREDELVRMAEQLCKMLDHEFCELTDSEADFVRQCMADLGW